MLFVTVVLTACSDSAGPSDSRSQLHVLLIGNSYTLFNSLDTLLERVATDAGKGKTIVASLAAKNNQSLQTLWQDGAALDSIKKGGWDYVVLQEWVFGPTRDANSFEDYAGRFDTAIRAQGGKTVLLIPWAPNFMPDSQTAITNSVKAVAGRLHARVAPAGPAWVAALAQKSSLPLYYQDGSHPDVLGSYLTAAVIYSTLFEESSESSSGSADQQLLRRVAWKTVSSF